MNGSEPITMKKEDICNIWQCMAAGFVMFDVNVTTDKAVVDAAGVSNCGISKFFNTSHNGLLVVSHTKRRQTHAYY